MNNLSWFLYFVDVVPGFLAGLAGVAGFLLLLGLIIAIILAISWADCPNGSYTEKRCARQLKRLGVAMCIITLFVIPNALCPSKETIYMIAASESGESLLQSKQGQKVMTILNQILNKKLNALTAQKGKE